MCCGGLGEGVDDDGGGDGGVCAGVEDEAGVVVKPGDDFDVGAIGEFPVGEV